MSGAVGAWKTVFAYIPRRVFVDDACPVEVNTPLWWYGWRKKWVWLKPYQRQLYRTCDFDEYWNRRELPRNY